MLRRKRTYDLVTALLVAAFGWTFILPIVHLACGMAMQQGAPSCVEHAASHDMASHGAMSENGAGHHHDATPCSGFRTPADDHAVECCWVETSPVERATLATSVPAVPSSTATHDAPELDEPSDERRTALPADDSAPPLSFQLLFSVFLI